MSPAKNLRVSFIQSSLHWERPDLNKSSFDEHIARLPATDIIVLPEMFTTGFTMNTALAEEMSGPSVAWMQDHASKKQSVVVGSLIIKDGGSFFNRLIWADPSGSINTYDKRHLFSFADEDAHFSEGTERRIVQYKGWRICPLICYDLRFPVWSRNHATNAGLDETVFDLLIYIANWPKARRQPWMNLLEARAHENQVYVVGVNRIGIDGKDIEYSGDSRVISPRGLRLDDCAESKLSIETIELDWNNLERFREKFPVGRDRDRFDLVD
ncbi:MAG: amidohydrolase [Flavobacteriales bacterium]|jgi:omega-amidase|nr:amidohydrolase [Flavobacteriales bacterium]